MQLVHVTILQYNSTLLHNCIQLRSKPHGSHSIAVHILKPHLPEIHFKNGEDEFRDKKEGADPYIHKDILCRKFIAGCMKKTV